MNDCTKAFRLYLIGVSSNNEDWYTRAMTGYGAQPEFETGVLMTETHVPRQNVDTTPRQEELQNSNYYIKHKSKRVPS